MIWQDAPEVKLNEVTQVTLASSVRDVLASDHRLHAGSQET